MKSLRLLKTGFALAGLLGALLCATAARASSYTISLDTSTIVGNAAGPFYLDFQSIFGSGAGQTVTLSDFTLTGGGFVAGTEGAFGAVGGDLGSSLTLSASGSSFYNEFFQQFEATVTNIKFDVYLSAGAAAGTPTSLAISVLDGFNLFAIPTTGFADTLVMFNIDGGNTSYETGTSVGATGGVTATVPDAGNTAGLMLGAILALGAARRLRRSAAPMAA